MNTKKVVTNQSEALMHRKARAIRGLLVFTTLFLILAPDGCESPTSGGIGDPRTFSWKVDSVQSVNGLQVLLQDVWGASSENVYAVGMTSGVLQQMYHFDGQAWSEVYFPRPQVSGQKIDLNAITGTGPSDVWAVGKLLTFNFSPPPQYFDSSAILHYDGSSWKIESTGLGGTLYCVSVSGLGQRIFGGALGTLLRLESGAWTSEHLPVPASISGLVEWSDGTISAVGYSSSPEFGNSTFYELEKRSGAWIVLDSISSVTNMNERFGTRGMMLKGSTLLTVGARVYERHQGGSWQSVFSDGANYLLDATSFRSEGVIACGNSSVVVYYDGKTWERVNLPIPSDVSLSGVWSNGVRVVFVGYRDGGRSSYLIWNKI